MGRYLTFGSYKEYCKNRTIVLVEKYLKSGLSEFVKDVKSEIDLHLQNRLLKDDEKLCNVLFNVKNYLVLPEDVVSNGVQLSGDLYREVKPRLVELLSNQSLSHKDELDLKNLLLSLDKDLQLDRFKVRTTKTFLYRYLLMVIEPSMLSGVSDNTDLTVVDDECDFSL